MTKNMQGTNAEKMYHCLERAEYFRDRYYQGCDEAGEGLSGNEKFIAEQRFQQHVEAKNIIGGEQMYSRWATMFGVAALVDKAYGRG